MSVSVALSILHAMRKGHIVVCGLSGSTVFFPQYFLNGTIFGKVVTEYKCCVFIFSTNFAWNISHCKKKWASFDEKCMLVTCKVPIIRVKF